MSAKYVKIDIGDLLTLEDGSIGFIISTHKEVPIVIKSQNPCREIPIGSPQYCSLIPLQHPTLQQKLRAKFRKKLEPVFTVRFPLTMQTNTYFARDIAHNVRLGKWKLNKGKRHETQEKEIS